MLRYQALQSHSACGAEWVWADLALLEQGDEYPIRPTCQQPHQIGRADRKRKNGADRRHPLRAIEGAELNFLIVPAGVQRLVGDAIDTTPDNSLPDHKLWLPNVVEAALTGLMSQSSFAIGIGATCMFDHQFASLPCRCSSRWCLRQSGTVNSSLTFLPNDRGWATLRWCASHGLA